MQQQEQYWYNLKTQQVEYGRLAPVTERVGPFATAAAAATAPQLLADRATSWAAEEAAADEWGQS